METPSKINVSPGGRAYIQSAVYLGILALPLVLLYWSTFGWLGERFLAPDSYYSHGFLIPLIALFLIWRNRRSIPLEQTRIVRFNAGLASRGNKTGLAIIITALLLHLAAVLTEVYFISGFSLILLLYGMSLFLLGRTVAGKVRFPIFFLIFMMPLPLVALNAVGFPLKMLVTEVTVFILRTIMHLPVRHEGFQIFFPNASLIVENPCSGLRSLVAMLTTGALFAYYLPAGRLRKCALFLLAVPIAVAVNILRVLLLSLGAYIYGDQLLHTFFHDATGYITFGLAIWLLWIAYGRMCRGAPSGRP